MEYHGTIRRILIALLGLGGMCAAVPPAASAQELGAEWRGGAFGSPIGHMARIAAANDRLWSVGYPGGLGSSTDGMNWVPVPGLPESAGDTSTFFRHEDAFIIINREGFWSSLSPEDAWRKVSGAPIPAEQLNREDYLSFKGRIHSVGGTSSSDHSQTWSTVDGTDWRLDDSQPPYSERRHFGAAVFRDKIWLLPGEGAGKAADDIWATSDGLNWERMLEKAPWAPRRAYACAVFKDRIYIVGGESNYVRQQDVWSSEDGVAWRKEPVDETYLTLATGFAVSGPTPSTYVWDGHLYVYGGEGLATWRTSDGVQWEFVPNSTPWSERSSFASVVFDGQVYMLGGEDDLGEHSSVWRTPDGEAWEEVTPAAPWAGRRGLGAAVKDGSIYVYGGASRTEIFNDVWRSANGRDWELVTADAGWIPRYYFGAVTWRGYLWMVAGMSASGPMWDVMRSRDGVEWEQMPGGGPGRQAAFGCTVHDDKLWIAGGTKGFDSLGHELASNHVYWTDDGMAWHEAGPMSTTRSVPVLRSYAGKLWVSGGYRETPFRGNEVFNSDLSWSADGETWHQANTTSSFGARRAHGMEFVKNRALIWGGGSYKGRHLSDIWISEGDVGLHDADTNGDFRISLGEVLRIIQFHNSDGIRCESGTEDGYAPGSGDTSCETHDADNSPQDWHVSLAEVLRLVQFYNSSSYAPCETGEDGFCPSA